MAAGQGRATFRSLQYRNFRLFFFGQLLSQVGNWARRIGLALLILEITDDGIAVGLLTAAQYGPLLVLGAWAGLLADRRDKRRVLMCTQSFALVNSLLLATLAFQDDPPLLAFYALALTGGIAFAFENPARRSLVVEMVPTSHVQNAVSLNSSLATGSRIVGPAMAGLLTQTVGYGWCFVIDALSYLVLLVALARMNPAELALPPVVQRGRRQVRLALHYVRDTPELFVPMVMMALIGTFAFNFEVVLPLLVTRSLGGDATDFTLLFSINALGAFCGTLITARRGDVRAGQLVVAAIGFGAAMGLLALAPDLTTAFVLAFPVGMASMIFMTSSTTVVQVRADPLMRGRVNALQSMLFVGSAPLGGPLLGAISEIGARLGVAVGAVSCFVAAASAAVIGRRATAHGLPADAGA